ncbi:hypothetical protein WAX74_03910 [Psychrobacillus sp. FJAT-51614]|uniref:Uncharacterized protein n=1 Tax=Psychrobacillus mangrovi TaxID=3117745 RepID=A0ABU8F3G4_9BACI
MGCLKYLLKLLGIVFIGIIIILGGMYVYMFTHDPPASSYNVSEEMYRDSQELLSVINIEFQSFNLSTTVNEERMDKVVDAIEGYTTKYVGSGSITAEEEELLQEIGKVVRDYIQLYELALSYQEVELGFNERFGDYSGENRNIYERYLLHKADLKDTYGFE